MTEEERKTVTVDGVTFDSPWLQLSGGDVAADHETMVAILLTAGELILGFFDGPSPLALGVLCSDTFAYACADLEPVASHDELEQVYRAWESDPKHGTTRWCVLKRRQMPLRPIVDAMREAGAWDSELAALEPESAS